MVVGEWVSFSSLVQPKSKLSMVQQIIPPSTKQAALTCSHSCPHSHTYTHEKEIQDMKVGGDLVGRSSTGELKSVMGGRLVHTCTKLSENKRTKKNESPLGKNSN